VLPVPSCREIAGPLRDAPSVQWKVRLCSQVRLEHECTSAGPVSCPENRNARFALQCRPSIRIRQRIQPDNRLHRSGPDPEALVLPAAWFSTEIANLSDSRMIRSQFSHRRRAWDNRKGYFLTTTRHFLLTTLGSLGDLHPYIAVGLGLRQRGHTVTIATSEVYRQKVDGEGLRFHPMRPDLGRLLDNPEVLRRVVHPRTGTEYVFRKLILPWLEQSFEDTLEAARNADLIVGHPIAFATPTAAEYLKKPWISIALQP